MLQGIILLFQALRQFFFLRERLKSLWLCVKVNFVTVFISNFLPGNTFGEAYKIWFFKKKNIPYIESFSIIVLDRIMASVVICVGGMSACFFMGLFVEYINVRLICCIILSMIFCLAVSRLVWGKLLIKIKNKLIFLTQIQKKTFVLALVISVIAYFLRLAKIYLIVQGLNSEISIAVLAIMLLFVQFATLLPISFGSLGVMEGGIFVVLVNFGVEPAIALSIALMNRCLLFFYSAVGGWFLLLIMFKGEDGNATERYQ